MSQRLRGGLINRDKPISFRFNGQTLSGFEGDTLASALIANGVRVVGRSFKYHRPRGIFSAGSEEPNALMTIGTGAEAKPNTRATMVELRAGLESFSQNHLGSLNFDLLAVNDLLAPFLSAGFYYKTFMWPAAFWEKLYEPAIRRAAGLGTLSGEEDPGLYDKGFLHCDLLVIGAGPAGLAAALAAGRAGAQVIIADEHFRLGGRLNAETHEIDGMAGTDWAAQCVAELQSLSNVRVMPRTTVFGQFDHGVFGAVEQVAPDALSADKPRQILWRVYAGQSVLAAGATERSLVFPGNDRPGVMLAGSVQRYANQYAAAAGQRVALFANHAGAASVARDLTAKGIEIAAWIDPRGDAPAPDGLSARHIAGGQIAKTSGRKGITGVTLRSGESIACDALAVSGGWSPNLHLTCHTDGKPRWRDDIQAFVPGPNLPSAMQVVGAANGTFGLGAILAEATEAGRTAAENAGHRARAEVPQAADSAFDISPFWQVEGVKGRAWVDLQNDVTSKDIAQACREGFQSVEHLKRYTTLGMATDQGKTANVAALAILAEQTGRTIPQTGTTRYRPPYTPVSIGAFAGRERGRDFQPYRYTPAHDWAVSRGASFLQAGLWERAEWFALPGEQGWRDSVDREAMHVRQHVGICDVSTLGKFDIQGRDATAFVNFVCANAFAKLPVGKVRYGLMLREDGLVMDDGTTARLADEHYLMTTTSGNAGPVYRHLEFVRQCLKPEWDVHLVPETDSWAQFSVAGPKSRALLEKLVDAPFDLSNAAFPFMACAELTICGGVRARLFRISFSGELAYEIAVPARYGNALGEVMMQAGEALEVVPYGLEANDVLRVEKGHPIGNELNGQTSGTHLGLGRMQSTEKDYIGRAMIDHTYVDGLEGIRLVGLKPVDRSQMLYNAAHFIDVDAEANQANDQGWMSSVCYSPQLQHFIGLGFVKNGEARMGEHIRAVDLLRSTDVLVEITSPHFFDPNGERLHG